MNKIGRAIAMPSCVENTAEWQIEDICSSIDQFAKLGGSGLLYEEIKLGNVVEYSKKKKKQWPYRPLE